MYLIKKLFISLLLISVTACGGGGDTKTLKQVVEQNKLNIVSLVLNSKYTQTLVPANTPGTTPTFYFTHGDSSEQITVTGITANGVEVNLSNIKFSIIDNSGGTSTIDDNGNLTLETFQDNITTKQITVQAEFTTLIGTATVMISSFPLQASGLLLYVNGSAAGATINADVCDTTLFEARGVFSDGSTRTITRKIDWPASINTNDTANAKFDVTDLSKPLFSSHTNSTYQLVVSHAPGPVTSNVDVTVAQGSFTNMVISPTSKTLGLNATQLLSLSATINNQQKTNLEKIAKWSSDDATVADVDLLTGVVTGKKIGGPVTITGVCGDASITSSVTVINIELVSIEIRDAGLNAISLLTFNITAGNPQTHKLSLFAHYSDGSEANISSVANISWSLLLLSGSVGAITVNDSNNKGLVTATLEGAATVTATYKGKRDTISVKVNVK